VAYRGARREKAAERAKLASFDRLTVQARLAAVLAGRLTAQELDDLVSAALTREKGTGGVANAAFQQLMSLAIAAIGETGDDSNRRGALAGHPHSVL
jgi:hypothetical protein